MRVEDGTGVGGVAPAGEAKGLTNGLAGDLTARVEDAGYDGRVGLGDISFEHRGAIHHREARDANVVLYGDPLAREGSLRCTLDGAPVVPGT